MHGWHGKVLEIDLETQETRETRPPAGVYQDFLGGRGLGVKLLTGRVNPKIDPLSPGNTLIFSVGPLTGTPTPLSARYAVVSKSPLTGTIFDCSCGGWFGIELKKTGLDAITINGRAEEPVYLEITPEGVEFHSAKSLWGLNVRETTRHLKERGRVACIGRAGEKQVPIAAIMSDYTHAAGRGGLGAVMGSKNLKAITVKGDQPTEVARPQDFQEGVKEILRLLEASPVTSSGLSEYGTSSLMNLINYMKLLPTRNFREDHFQGAWNVSGEAIKEKYQTKKHACPRCPIACKHTTQDGIEVPEYETLWAFGPDNNNPNLETIIKANRLCNEYGLDTISTGAQIACHAETTKSDIPPHEIPELVKEIGEGKQPPSKPELKMAVKNLELPGYDPRGALGQALGYATSNRGGCHLRAYMVAPEILGKPKKINPQTFQGKPGLLQIFQNEAATLDSLIICKFTSFAIQQEELAKILSATTNINYKAQDLHTIGERIWNLERLFNLKAGFTRADDTLPPRFFQGKNAINPKEFQEALDQYYHYRGWNPGGIPEDWKLQELKLQT